MSDETWVVTLPKLGESVTEGVIGTFFKNVGDEVEFDDPLFEVSTDKVDTEVPSSYDGVVLEVLAQEGDTVSVGAAIMRIGGEGRHGGEPTPFGRTRAWRRPVAVPQRSRPRLRWADRRARRPRTPTSRRPRG